MKQLTILCTLLIVNILLFLSTIWLKFGNYKEGHYLYLDKNLQNVLNYPKIAPYLEKYYQFMENLAYNYSFFCKLYKIGEVPSDKHSEKNLPILNMVISTGNPKPIIVILGGLKGGDILAPLALMKLMVEWVTNAESMKKVLSLYDYHIIPLVLPNEYNTSVAELSFIKTHTTIPPTTKKPAITPPHYYIYEHHKEGEDGWKPFNPENPNKYLENPTKEWYISNRVKLEPRDLIEFRCYKPDVNDLRDSLNDDKFMRAKILNVNILSTPDRPILGKTDWKSRYLTSIVSGLFKHNIGLEVELSSTLSPKKEIPLEYEYLRIYSWPWSEQEKSFQEFKLSDINFKATYLMEYKFEFNFIDVYRNYENFFDIKINVTSYAEGKLVSTFLGSVTLDLIEPLEYFTSGYGMPLEYIHYKRIHRQRRKKREVNEEDLDYLDKSDNVEKTPISPLFNFNYKFFRTYAEGQERYGGKVPFSTTEAIILRDYFMSIRTRTWAVLNLFSPIDPLRENGNDGITYPWAFTKNVSEKMTFMDYLTEVIRSEINEVLPSHNLTVCQSAEYTKYPQFGRLDDWLYKLLKQKPVVNLHFSFVREDTFANTLRKFENDVNIKVKLALEKIIYELYWGYLSPKTKKYFRPHFYPWSLY